MKLFTNAKIYTVDGPGWEARPVSAMLVADDGRVAAVGSDEGIRAFAPAAAGTTTIDLGGRTVLPGFVDAHVHAPGSAFTEMFEIYLYGTRDREGTLRTIRDFVTAHPEREAYFGTGYYMSIFDGAEAPPRRWLDRICQDRPIVLQSSDGHSLWLNTKALEACGITRDTPAPVGGKIGRWQGTARRTAS